MSWHALAIGLNSKMDADTGTGGLANSGSPIVNGYWNLLAPQETETPYIVMSPTLSEEFDSFTAGDQVRVEFDVAIFGPLDEGTATVATIAARVRTVLHRQAITPGTGWTMAGALRRLGSTGPIVDDQVVQQVEFYEAVMVKS